MYTVITCTVCDDKLTAVASIHLTFMFTTWQGVHMTPMAAHTHAQLLSDLGSARVSTCTCMWIPHDRGWIPQEDAASYHAPAGTFICCTAWLKCKRRQVTNPDKVKATFESKPLMQGPCDGFWFSGSNSVSSQWPANCLASALAAGAQCQATLTVQHRQQSATYRKSLQYIRITLA